MPVYMIQAGGEGGPIKIGVADNLPVRLGKMRTDNHEQLNLLRLFVGSRPEETELHRRFSCNHLHGEWFTFSEAMLGEVGLTEIIVPTPAPTKDGPMKLIRDKRGLLAKVARNLGMTRAAVVKWQQVPAERVVDVERITGIRREELRPDLYAKTEAA